MILDRLEVRNCRNLSEVVFEPSHSLNLIVGPNGAGKTSLLEAVHLLVRGKSFRRGGVDSVVQHGQANMDLAARWRGPNRMVVGRCLKERSVPIKLERDGKPLQSISEAALLVPILVLLPEMTELVFGSPVIRRQWLDWGVFHVKPQFAQEHRQYRHALSQRNAALRSRESTMIRLWTDRLAEAAEPVVESRREYMHSLRSYLQEWLAHMCTDFVVDVDIFNGFRGSSIQKELEKQLPRDVELGITRYGPHRADIVIHVHRDAGPGRAANRTIVSMELSRGQGKAVACAMNLAQARHLKEHRTVPVFLIDDIGSEFDPIHAERLVDALQEIGAQVLATTISATDFPMRKLLDRIEGVKIVQVDGGALYDQPMT